MPETYNGKVSKDLFEAFRSRARAEHPSVAAEVLAVLEENVPTQKELKARQAWLRNLKRRSEKAIFCQSFPSTEEMQREDRGR